MELGRLMEYHYWATDRLLDVVEQLTPEQFARDLGSSFPSVQATVAHLLTAEAVWLGRITGRPPARVSPHELPLPADARRRWQPLREEMGAWAASLEETGAARSVRAVTSSGAEYLHTGEEVALHLVVHGSYHRGQVVTMLRQLGVAPPSLDLIAFFRT